MTDKAHMLELLDTELEHWKNLVSPLSEKQATTPSLPNGWSVKDLLAHLMAWQQVTRARLEAAQRGETPTLPSWLGGADPDGGDVDPENARIYDAYQGQAWQEIQQGWQHGFNAILSLAETLAEDDLYPEGKYVWLNGYPLIAVLQGTYKHHHDDHLPVLLAYTEGLETT